MVRRDSPTARRQRILRHALTVFGAHGYVGTSTDQLAAAASVSKQTLYKEFGDKEGVFSALIQSACDQVDDPFESLVEQLERAPDSATAVALLAAQFTRSIMAPEVQQLRRLVIAEAGRFPHLGQLYWDNGFQRVLGSVARCLQVLDERGLLAVPDARQAAEHFAGILLWIPSNRAMFAPDTSPEGGQQLREFVEAGAQAFVRAYAAEDGAR